MSWGSLKVMRREDKPLSGSGAIFGTSTSGFPGAGQAVSVSNPLLAMSKILQDPKYTILYTTQALFKRLAACMNLSISSNQLFLGLSA